jgi:hypothetical protein
VPTLKDPNPPAEWVVTFPMLINMNVPPQTARLLMAVMGSDWTDPEAEEPGACCSQKEVMQDQSSRARHGLKRERHTNKCSWGGWRACT